PWRQEMERLAPKRRHEPTTTWPLPLMALEVETAPPGRTPMSVMIGTWAEAAPAHAISVNAVNVGGCAIACSPVALAGPDTRVLAALVSAGGPAYLGVCAGCASVPEKGRGRGRAGGGGGWGDCPGGGWLWGAMVVEAHGGRDWWG